MGIKYKSEFKGSEIDEAVRKVLYEYIELDDLSDKLIQQIQSWATARKGVHCSLRKEFPIPGSANTLYIATDELISYIWEDDQYKELNDSCDFSSITLINCGGAK